MLNASVPTYTLEDIVDLAGQRSYDRGLEYLECISGLAVHHGQVTATVQGRDEYQVVVDVDGGLDGSCDCPHGEEGNFCKHCVAVALVYLFHAEHGTLAALATPAAESPPQPDDLAGYLSTLDRDDLMDLLLDAADRDPALRRRLELRTTVGTGTPRTTDLAATEDRIARLLAVNDYTGDDDYDYYHGYVPYAEAHGYGEAVSDVTALLRELAETDGPEAAADLAGRALRRVGEAVSQVDDSDGYVGGAATELAELHADLCADAHPEPTALATWLLDFQTAGFDWPELTLAAYAPALGEAGLASYGEQLTARWRDWAERGTADPSGDSAVRLMADWTERQGDVDLLVRVLSSDTRYGVPYRRIVDALAKAGRDDEALAWAERGLADSSVKYLDDALVAHAAGRYAADGRAADVLALRRDHFRRRPAVETYRTLRDAALAAGDAAWPDTRAWALALVRPAASRSAADRPAAGQGRYGGSGGYGNQDWYGNHGWHGGTLLVDLLLSEGATEEAWQAAQQHGAAGPQWLRVAQLRGTTHPRDAITVYQRQIEGLVNQRNNQSYAEAADLGVRVRALYARIRELGENGKVSQDGEISQDGKGRRVDEGTVQAEESAYFAQLRAAHKPKRNFMAELTRRGL